MIYRSSFQKNKVYFHLAARTCERRMTEAQLKNLWSELPRRFKRHRYLELHSCVLMSNHLHALFSVQEIYFEMAESSLLAEFQSLFFKASIPEDFFRITRIKSFAAYREAYRYTYRNPVEAGIVPLAELYTYSTLREIMGYSNNHFLANDNMGLISNPYMILGWLNSKSEKEQTLH